MDAAGAYQLIDEDTGEKVIVWGGTDVLDAPIPSKDVLDWKPESRRPRKQRPETEVFDATGAEATATVSEGGSKHIKRVGARVGGFDRLKSQNIRALIKKSSRVTKEKAQSNVESSVSGTSSDEAYGIESVQSVKETTLDLLRHKHLQRDTPNNAKVQDTNYLPNIPKQDVGPSRVWLKQHRKRSTDNAFFSRKSFKELGGSDDIIESLRSQMFVRPSHIQLLLNCRSIAKFGVPFRSMVATGGFRQKTQLDSLQQELDVLIATPGRFNYLFKEGFVLLTNLKCVVLDEVDVLYGDEDFEQVFQSLINSAQIATQYLFVTATLPIDIYNKLIEIFPDCEVAIGPGMHRTSSGLEEVLVNCSGDDGEEKNPETAFLNKKAALMQLVEGSQVPKTIIFCNKIETCRKVENILKRFDREEFRIKSLPFHAAIAQEIRLSNMKEFLNSESEDSMFLICTDRASRGIDFRKVDHVILFDFPRDPSEYVRRVGRTARGAGGVGKAFVFVVGKQVSLARRILERNQKGHPLHEVPSAYELERSVL